MKHVYIRMLTVAVLLVSFVTLSKAQTYVTVYSDDFENYGTGTNLASQGYEIWEGTARANTDLGKGHNGSNGFAASDNSKNNFTFLRSIFPLVVGETYRVSAATLYTDGVNHNPLNIRKINSTGVDQGSSYFNNGVAKGTGAWQEWSEEVVIEAGAEGVRIQHYRFGKAHVLQVDDVKVETNSGTAWNGAVSTDWHTAGNWAGNAVPSASDHILIPDVSNQPNISNSNAEVTSLEIANGATLAVSGGQTLTVIGQLTGDNTGFVEVMSGSSLIADRVIGSAHIFHRQTRFSNGQYSVVGSPVRIGRVSDLGALVYKYNESMLYNSTVDNAGSGNNGLDRFIKMATTTDTLGVGSGYFSASTDMLTFIGNPNTGTINVGLTVTDHDGTNALDENNYEGFNLVSNPYPSSVDYEQFVTVNGATGSGIISSSIWIWDDNGSSSVRGSNADYVTINDLGVVSTQSSSASGIWDKSIRSGQGFFVKATAAGDLAFTPAMQSVGKNTDGGFYRKGKVANFQTIKINVSQPSTDLYNETLIGFAEDASLAIDALDAQKIASTGALKLYSLVGNKALAIQSLPFGAEEIQLGIYADTDGDYSFSLGDTFHWDNGYSIYLNDAMTGIITDLTNGGTYQFSAKSGASDRFSISLSRSLLSLDEWNSDFEIISSLNEIKLLSTDNLNQAISLTLSDVSGKVLFQTESTMNKGMLTVPYNFTSQQIYILSVRSSKMTLIKKFIIK